MKHRHFILNKPYGYLSQFVNNQNKRRNKKLLGSLYDFPEGTMHVGRLDEKSEGLICLTTDGKVSEEVRSKQVEKEYLVEVDGLIDLEAIDTLRKGVLISIEGGKYQTLPCKAWLADKPEWIWPAGKKRGASHGPTSWANIVINEGKFRQVRKMTAAVGFPTIRLIRIRIGSMRIGDLKPGEVLESKVFTL